jgi:hypothetical protein
VQVGAPEHHRDRRHTAHSALGAELPTMRRSASFSASSAAELALDQLPLTPSLAALVSSAHLPARQQPGFKRTRSRSKSGADPVLQQATPPFSPCPHPPFPLPNPFLPPFSALLGLYSDLVLVSCMSGFSCGRAHPHPCRCSPSPRPSTKISTSSR